MGQPKFPRKKYDAPLHPWKEDRIKSERELIKKYGLKNHREVWKAKTFLRNYRAQARELLAKVGGKDPQVKRESEQLLLHLTRLGILPAGGSLDDVLALDTESVLSRRVQTLVYLKGLASTSYQSRQLINHGHIAIGERKVTIPSYIVPKDEEVFISYTSQSPLNEVSHPARPKTETFKTTNLAEKTTEGKEESKEKTPPSKEKDEKVEEKTQKETKENTQQEKTETATTQDAKEQTAKSQTSVPAKQEKKSEKPKEESSSAENQQTKQEETSPSEEKKGGN
jgi:small subunit ribosomal protein S4